MKKIVFFIILGFIFRVILASFTYDGLTHDVGYYVILAKKILTGALVVDCCGKNAGYPVFLAITEVLFGTENVWAVRFVQIIIDLISALVIFKLARRIFENKKAPWISFILYLFNPFTASYTGLRLPETITIFIVVLTLLIISAKTFLKKIYLWFLLGAVLGISLFIRLQFYYFAFVIIFVLSLICFRGIKRLYFLLLAFLGFLVFSSYTLIANYNHFKKLTLTPPYNLTFAFLYMNFYDYNYPELFLEDANIHPEMQKIMTDYLAASFSKDYVDVKKLNDKYKALFFKNIKDKWPVFLVNTGKNIIRLWDKTHLLTYTDPFYPKDIWFLRVINIASIILFFKGMIVYIRQRKGKIRESPVVVYSVLLFLYITFLFSLVTNEKQAQYYFLSNNISLGGIRDIKKDAFVLQ